MGKSRSGLFNAAVAMKILDQWGGGCLVRRRRAGAFGNQVFAAYLQSLSPPNQPDARSG